MNREYALRLLICSLSLLIASCGGGGGSSGYSSPTQPTPVASSNWDAAMWDQFNWN